ncbi:ATP-dependent endonuclease [Acinetobacter sp. YH12236]|uniref:ATP-dependent nuclease n=2 Tax=unclassified Acinetobacter TaxID=196816 RepID=UPI0015D37190|nr:AAA family ATPase [Acinetobacter sp. YH12236]
MNIPKIKKLIIKNFGCIGSTPVSIDIDKVVILVGANNAGKSTILKAIEVVTDCLELEECDFHNNQIDPQNFPEIEVHSIATNETKPGDEWCEQISDQTYLIKEKWTWTGTKKAPERIGYNVFQGRFAISSDKEKMPWGINNVAKSKRPKPHRVSTFDEPEIQAKAIKSLLKSLLDTAIKSYKSNPDDEKTDYEKIINLIDILKISTKTQQQENIVTLEVEANSIISKIFPNHELKITSPNSNLEYSIEMLGDEFDVQMGAIHGEKFPLEKQGSGSRRTALWTILKLLADKGIKAKKGTKSQHENLGSNSSHILLLDEPEVSLHPLAIANARDVLYSLPDSQNWQIMIATHSPNFIDLTKDNTTIIRVEKNIENSIETTTLFSPEQTKLDENDKENLKLMNLFDSHISHAFFGGKILIVEGDTEYSAFNYIRQRETEIGNQNYHNLNIIRARGKVTVASMMKVLNHFKNKYYVLHDSDTPKCQSRKLNKQLSCAKNKVYDIVEINNPAWTNNSKIQDQMGENCKVISSLINFEHAYFSETISSNKPENSINKIKSDPQKYILIKQLLDSILDLEDAELPDGALEWSDISELEQSIPNIQFEEESEPA